MNILINESRLTLEEAGVLLPNRHGQPTWPTTVRRYINRGVQSISGTIVKLEGYKAPAAGLCTTREAVARFVAAMNDTATPVTSTATSPGVLAAEAELAAAGIN